MSSTVVSVPGKLILMGEHAVVYGRPALVAAVDLRLRASIRDEPVDGVRMVLPQIADDVTVPWDDLRAYAADAGERWRAFAAGPTPDGFRRVRGEDPAHVVKVALGEAARDRGEDSEAGMSLRVDSGIPIGSGFGSSAAAAVAIVAAYRQHRGCPWRPAEVDRIALEVERRQHGLPSGVDHATVIAGGVLWARRAGDGTVSTRPLTLAPGPLSRLQVYDSGPPSESTGDVVASVGERLRARRDGGLLDEMERATIAFREQLEREAEDGASMVEILRRYERCLESLGVVPAPVRSIVRGIEAAGGAAKISGAGSLTGTGAGGMLVYPPEGGLPEEITAGLRRHRVGLGADGLRREEAA